MSKDGDERPGQGRAFALALSLSALAGFVDATGYIRFHHLFVSFMSGNSTQAMVAAAQHDLPKLVLVVRTIVLFVGGVTIGELVAATSARWGRPLALALELLLMGLALAAALLGGGETWTSGLLASAMGVQNAVVHKAEGIKVALTYITGTLVTVGREIAAALRGAAPWHAPLPLIAMWVALVFGGLLGAFAADRSLILALVLATSGCLAMLSVTVVAALVLWRPLELRDQGGAPDEQ